MNNYYKITLPTPQRALELGYTFEGQTMRTLNWLSGLAFGLDAVDSAIVFKVVRYSDRLIVVETDSVPLMGTIEEHLQPYGMKTEQVSKEFAFELK